MKNNAQAQQTPDLAGGCPPLNPLQGPLRLLLDTWHSLNGMKEPVLLHRVTNVLLQQQRIHLAVDVLDRNLEAIECTSLHQANTAEARGLCMMAWYVAAEKPCWRI